MNDNTIQLRLLRPDEMEWANACYAEVGFRPYSADQLLIVAEIDGERAGIGRLAPVAESEAELSGMYTVPAFRGRGVADAVVTELLQRSNHQLLYCIPLPHLESFYGRFGFVLIDPRREVPCQLASKLSLCNRDSASAVRLFTRVQTGGVVLRPATPADCALLRHWDTLPHVLASDPNDDWEWETELGRDVDWREQLIAEYRVDGKASRRIGIVQIIDPAREESHYWGDCEPNLRAIDIWIGEEDCLGRGLGTVMMRQALDRCFADPAVTAVVIDPLARHTRAHPFYQRLGFVPQGLHSFGEDECLVHRLTREAWLASRKAAAVS